MRKRIAPILGGIVVIAIVTEILSSKNTTGVLGNLSAVFSGSVWGALHPSDASVKQRKNALFISTASELPASGNDYFAKDVPVAWMIGGGSSGSASMGPTPNPSPMPISNALSRPHASTSPSITGLHLRTD